VSDHISLLSITILGHSDCAGITFGLFFSAWTFLFIIALFIVSFIYCCVSRTVTVIVRGGLLQLVSSGRSGIRGGALVAADLGLTFPVSLVEDLHLVLEGNQRLRLPNPGELVLESIWEPLIELPVEGFVIPAGARCVPIEVEGVFHSLAHVLVPKVLDADSGFIDRVARVEEAVELVNEHPGRG